MAIQASRLILNQPLHSPVFPQEWPHLLTSLQAPSAWMLFTQAHPPSPAYAGLSSKIPVILTLHPVRMWFIFCICSPYPRMSLQRMRQATRPPPPSALHGFPPEYVRYPRRALQVRGLGEKGRRCQQGSRLSRPLLGPPHSSCWTMTCLACLPPLILTNPALLEGSQRGLLWACMKVSSCPLQGPLLPSHVQRPSWAPLQTSAPTKARGPASQEIKPTDSGLSRN